MHRVHDCKDAVTHELLWFSRRMRTPKSIHKNISSVDINAFKSMVQNNPHKGKNPGPWFGSWWAGKSVLVTVPLRPPSPGSLRNLTSYRQHPLFCFDSFWERRIKAPPQNLLLYAFFMNLCECIDIENEEIEIYGWIRWVTHPPPPPINNYGEVIETMIIPGITKISNVVILQHTHWRNRAERSSSTINESTWRSNCLPGKETRHTCL